MTRRADTDGRRGRPFRWGDRAAWGTVLAVLALAAAALLPPILQPAADAQGVEATPTPEPGLVRSYRVLTAPVIDGNLSDWPLLGAVILNTDTAFSYNGVFSNYADGSTTCWSQWNDTTLFVACDVLDDILIADSTNIWLDDTIELAFDGKNDNIRFCGTVFCSDDHLYELRVDGAVRDNDLAVSPGVTGAVGQRQGGYRLEIAIPWTQFDAGAFVAGKVMGFNLGLIDDDDGGGTEGHLYWRGYSTYSQPENFGDIVLDPRTGTPVFTATPTATVTPTRTRTPTPSPTSTATPVPLINTASAEPIACGQTIRGITQGTASNVYSYGCVPWWPETGPEKVYRLTLSAGIQVDALLAGMTSDLDLFLLTGASPASCVAYGDTGFTAAAAPGTYYLVVDGFNGAAGSFTLSLWCPLEPSPGPTRTPTVTPTPGPSIQKRYIPLVRAD